MPSNDSFKTAKDGAALVSEIIKVAGDNPNAKEAANNLGKTAVTLTKAINNALLPLAAINFACEKARIYFTSRFQQELSDKVSKIPTDDIVEPNASIAGPILHALAFNHEEQDLKGMYLNLLATAMDGRASTAHPSFVSIIQQLTSDEAKLLRYLAHSETEWPMLEITGFEVGETGPSSEYQLQFKDWCNNAGVMHIDSSEAYLDNLMRLQILSRTVSNTVSYAPPGNNRYGDYDASVNNEIHEVLELTSYGRLFLDACIDKSEANNQAP